MAASASRVEPIEAAARSKVWRSRRRPPANRATPSTSRLLPRIEPVRLALTMSSSPRRSAASAMTSSAALPKVAFSRPPTPAPKRRARASVAAPIVPASGTMASAAQAKTTTPLQWSWCPITASGTKSSNPRSRCPGAANGAGRGRARGGHRAGLCLSGGGLKSDRECGREVRGGGVRGRAANVAREPRVRGVGVRDRAANVAREPRVRGAGSPTTSAARNIPPRAARARGRGPGPFREHGLRRPPGAA